MSPRSRSAREPGPEVESEPDDGPEPGVDDPGAEVDESEVDESEPGPDESEDSESAGSQPGPAAGAEAEPGSDTEPLGLSALLAERDAHLADLQRVTAEFTNFRRQTVRRNTELVSQAASRLATALLPVLDAVEAAVGQGVDGMEAVQAQLLGVLGAEGLSVIGSVEEPFDPGVHEAVMSEEAGEEGEAGPVVAEVLRTGYAWNGRVLRPAMVKVRT